MKKEVKSTNEILENFAFHVNSLMESWFSNESQAIKENDYDIIAQSGAKLLSIAAKSCHFKDEFEASYSLGLLLSSSIISKKTYTAYELNFNMYKGYLSFEAYIGDAEYLKNMQDDFYIEFFSACQKYGFEYDDGYGGTSGKSIFHKSIKSNIFRLIRNYTKKVITDKNGLDVFQYESLGKFRKVWDCYNLDFEQMYNELCIAMKYFYKFNYHLWKAKDEELKKKSRKADNM